MSYRIAHVRFRADGQTYPVNCLRADIAPGNRVVVFLPHREPKLKRAEVVEVAYLNWGCSNTIVGLMSEVNIYADGTYTVTRGHKDPSDIDDLKDLTDLLIKRGWRAYFSANKNWNLIYTKAVRDLASYILLRANGIDFVTCPTGEAPNPEGRRLRMLLSNRRCVRHGYYGSGVDLYRFTVDFVEAVEAGTSDLDNFFVPRGGPQPRPPTSSETDLPADFWALCRDPG